MKKHLLSFLFLCVLLLTSCFRPIEEIISDGVQQLVIDNAFYVNDLFSCTIQFDYYVTEDTCNVGGWAIDFQDGRRNVMFWYSMQKCIPGVRYTIQHSYKHRAPLPPIVGMSGYPLHANDSFTSLVVEDTLQLRY